MYTCSARQFSLQFRGSTGRYRVWIALWVAERTMDVILLFIKPEVTFPSVAICF
jgi:hypothetical protein